MKRIIVVFLIMSICVPAALAAQEQNTDGDDIADELSGVEAELDELEDGAVGDDNDGEKNPDKAEDVDADDNPEVAEAKEDTDAEEDVPDETAEQNDVASAETGDGSDTAAGMTEAQVRKMVDAEVEKRMRQLKSEQSDSSAAFAKNPAEKQKSVKRRGFVDTSFSKNRIGFIIGDDNLRDDSMYSPGMKISDDKLYDDFTNRFTSYDNRGAAATRLTLLHEDGGLIPHVTTRLAISLGIGTNFQRWNFYSPSLYENGSFIEVMYSDLFDFGVKLYPYNSDAIAVGFLNGLRWGDRSMWPENLDDREPVPGGQFVVGYGPLTLYSALKTKFQPTRDTMSDEMVEQEVRYAGFFGASYNSDFGLRIDLEGTYADKGENPVIGDELLPNAKDDDIVAYGFDMFSQYSHGNFIGEPLGISVYDSGKWRDPDYSAFGLRFRGEGIMLNERLQNADYLGYEEGDATADEPMTDDFYAYGFAFETAVMLAHLRFFGLFSYRSFTYLVFDSPGFTPYETIPDGADIQNEMAFSLHLDYNWKVLWFGISYGFKRPAAYRAPGSNTYTVIKDRTNNFAGSTDFSRSREPLPDGEDPLNIAVYKAHLRVKFSDSLSTNIQYGFMQDHNRSKIVSSDGEGGGTGVERKFDDNSVKNIHSLIFSFIGRF